MSRFRLVLELQLKDKAKKSPYTYKTAKDIAEAVERGEIVQSKVSTVGGIEE